MNRLFKRALLFTVAGLIGVASLTGVTGTASAWSKWKNPSEKYADAYKQYASFKCPIKTSRIKHFVYFARARESIHGHAFLKHSRFAGAQIMYPWSILEPKYGVYDFSSIQADIAYLAKYNKKLFIQIQDATFNPKTSAIPAYLKTSAYDNGEVYQLNDAGEPEGRVAKRWDTKVRQRFAVLLKALGKAVDQKVAGVNLQESAIGVRSTQDASFTPVGYRDGLLANMQSLKVAFPTASKLQYANFMPEEWLPWNDKGYLRSIYQFGNANGIGLGAPDLMVQRKGQLNHALAMMHESTYKVPLGIAVQDGNYIGQTNVNIVQSERKNLVPMLHAFAEDFLNVDYLFWSNEPPYLEEDVLACFTNN